MSDPVASRTGSCQCGAVQKLTGSVFASFVTVKDEQLTITVKSGFDEESTLKKYADSSAQSGSAVQRTFCGYCGSPILNRNEMMPTMPVVHLGILEPYPMSEDGAVGTEGQQGVDLAWTMKPAIEYWCIRKRKWVGETGAELVFKRQPEPETEEFAKLMKIYGLA
ncbi:hypothetical protein PG999_004601 [Apiospora kogelbergensis]|uniref:CENP-V/GFA domain-containing protein n=1 Tax=Apiospora kogelbergensis TaxID=1337665 RepID=A0AAW0QZQ4_9PEZI